MARAAFRLLPLLLVIVVTAACGSAPVSTQSERPEPPAFTLPREVRIRTAGRVVRVPLDEYVLGTALSEVSPVGEARDTAERVFEVQAILARTYAVSHLGRHAAEGFDLCDGTHCQLYEPSRIQTSRFSATAREAVHDTSKEILMFGARPAEALFHADCGGHTASAGDVWGGRPVLYLTGITDAVPQETHRHWRLDVAASRLLAALNVDGRTRLGSKLTGITISDRDASDRATAIELRGDRQVRVSGEQFRAVLNQTLGARAVQSTRFTVSRQESTYHLAGTGFGHGVGLCQVGAAARARRGDSVAEILSAYFPGAAVVNLR